MTPKERCFYWLKEKNLTDHYEKYKTYEDWQNRDDPDRTDRLDKLKIKQELKDWKNKTIITPKSKEMWKGLGG